MLIFVDWISLLTSAEITVLCVIYRAIFVGGRIKNLSSIEEKIGRIFECGTVIVDGTMKEYNILSSKPEVKRYPDARIIAEGDIETIKYTEAIVKPKRS